MMNKTAILFFAFAAIPAVCRAENLQGIVEDFDPLSKNVSIFRVDTSDEPRRVRLHVDSETILTGVTSVQDLKRGSEVKVDADRGEDAWQARSLELLGTPDETEKNLESARTAAVEGDDLFFQAVPAARASRKDASSAAAAPASPAGGSGSDGTGGTVVAEGLTTSAATADTVSPSVLSPGATAASDIATLPSTGFRTSLSDSDATIESQESVRTPSATSTPTVGAGASTGDQTPFMGGTGSTGRAESGSRVTRNTAPAGGQIDQTPFMGGTGSVSRATDPAPAGGDGGSSTGTASGGSSGASGGTS